MHVSGISRGDIDQVWPDALGLLQPALDRTQAYTADDVLDGLREGRMQLWLGHEGGPPAITAMVTQITGTRCWVALLGGKRFRECWPEWGWFCDWARAQGAETIEAEVRKGQTRVLTRRFGFRVTGKGNDGDIVKVDLKRMNELNEQNWIDTRLHQFTMGGGGSQPAGNTTTTQVAEPWEGQKPFLTQAFQAAQNLYGSGGPQYFPDSTVASQSPQTQAAIAMEAAAGANGNPAVKAATGTAAGVMSGSPMANPGNGMFTGVANSNNPALGLAERQAAFGPAGSGTLAQVAQNGVPNAAQGYLGGIANGSQNLNPYLADQFNALSADIANKYQTVTAPQVDSGLEAAGRFGSGAMMTARSNADRDLASQLSTAGSTLLGNAYENMANRQISAAQDIQGANQADVAARANAAGNLGQLGLSATGQLGQIGQYDAANDLAAATGVSGNYNTARQNQLGFATISPSLQQAQVQQIAMMGDAGQQTDAYNQALLNDQINRFNYGQMLPYQNVGTFEQFINGNYGGTTTTTQPFFKNGNSQLGGALSGAATGAMLGSVFPGVGTVVGAGVGGLLGAFA